MSERDEPMPAADDTTVTTGAVAEPATDDATRTRRLPPYHVVILNDEEHSFGYVIEMLMRLFRHPEATAERLTRLIDRAGRAIVFTTHKELAELKRDQVLSYGPDPSMSISRGPLACYIEPAEAG